MFAAPPSARWTASLICHKRGAIFLRLRFGLGELGLEAADFGLQPIHHAGQLFGVLWGGHGLLPIRMRTAKSRTTSSMAAVAMKRSTSDSRASWVVMMSSAVPATASASTCSREAMLM